MTPQQFVEWGRRIADDFAAAATRSGVDQRTYEFDSQAIAADEFLSKANNIARAFTIPGGELRLAQTPALRELPERPQEADFEPVYQAMRPALCEILEGMWLGEWEFNDSGLIGTLKIAPGPNVFHVVYIDSQGVAHDTAVTCDDEEYGMSYESLHIEIQHGARPPWKIHAFIFRWDRRKMAGIVDHGETEGRHSFYAVKR